MPAIASVAELPFHERPLRELLHLAAHRDAPDPAYAGYGWARAPRVWLATPRSAPRPIDDALVLALHSADDAEALADDIELYFELPDAPPVTALASRFLARWLPRLPQDARAIVLALCNPHGARLPAVPGARAPLHHATGDVESWLTHAPEGPHIDLVATAWREVEVPT